MRKLYVIEKRHDDGSLDLSEPQPHQMFGDAAIHGIDEDRMAATVWRFAPDATLTGADIQRWPAHVHPKFLARAKYW